MNCTLQKRTTEATTFTESERGPEPPEWDLEMEKQNHEK